LSRSLGARVEQLGALNTARGLAQVGCESVCAEWGRDRAEVTG